MCDSQKLIVANLSLDMFTMIGFAMLEVPYWQLQWKKATIFELS
jgi:hypothetical protein